VLRRLRELPAPAADLAQELVDACFAYLELGFRNGGISDIAVPKRMKKIAQSFFGRVQAYEAALVALGARRAGRGAAPQCEPGRGRDSAGGLYRAGAGSVWPASISMRS
jgi:cytochrome b pre-mRNA-processing protein 3